jgi:hypothetical protein
MAKKKKAAKRKQRTIRPKKVTVSVTKRTTIGKARSTPRGSGYYIKAAKDKLYDELGMLMVRKEKAPKKSAKKKIAKKITEVKRKINRLK